MIIYKNNTIVLSTTNRFVCKSEILVVSVDSTLTVYYAQH